MLDVFSNMVMAWFGYAKGSVEGNIIADISVTGATKLPSMYICAPVVSGNGLNPFCCGRFGNTPCEKLDPETEVGVPIKLELSTRSGILDCGD